MRLLINIKAANVDEETVTDEYGLVWIRDAKNTQYYHQEQNDFGAYIAFASRQLFLEYEPWIRQYAAYIIEHDLSRL
jgi:hypothetical protein